MMRKILGSKYFFIVLLITINLIVGFMTIDDYGESWDEEPSFNYANQSIDAYKAIWNPSIKVQFGKDILQFYGPAYLMATSLFTKGTQNLFPNLFIAELWHISNFICLQFGILCFYFLALRFTDKISAIAATALMSTQPLIWGHGFINPKDIPLMAFFTATVLFGLKLLDVFAANGFEIKKLFVTPQFYMAGIMLGVTISIRVLGLAAGGVILCYLAFINIKKVLRVSYSYYGLALVVTFFTWPYLWESPVKNFLTSLSFAVKFVWPGYTLFDGNFYHPDEIPRLYAPKLFAMQLTETALFLLCLGLFIILLPKFRAKNKNLLFLIFPWFIVPALYILIFKIKLFDNLRHLLFLYPAAFLIMAAGLDVILNLAKSSWLKVFILILILFPGVAGIVRYHPFEYTYYNTVTTSTTSIFRNYEQDYWATCYKKTASWLNENAPKNARTLVWGPDSAVQHYVREDIRVQKITADYHFQNINESDMIDNESLSHEPYYVVLSSRWDVDRHVLPELMPIYSVEREGSLFCAIKYLDVQK